MLRVPRVAFFPDSYLDINGAAMTCRKLTAFARDRNYPFLCVYADRKTEKTIDGSITNLALKRSLMSIPMNEDLKYDPLFNRYLKRVGAALDEFKPDLLHLTGINDVSILAAILAHQKKIPLIGSWHTNLHEFASRRLEKLFSFTGHGGKGFQTQRKNRFYGSYSLLQNAESCFGAESGIDRNHRQRFGARCLFDAAGIDVDFFSPEKGRFPMVFFVWVFAEIAG